MPISNESESEPRNAKQSFEEFRPRSQNADQSSAQNFYIAPPSNQSDVHNTFHPKYVNQINNKELAFEKCSQIQAQNIVDNYYKDKKLLDQLASHLVKIQVMCDRQHLAEARSTEKLSPRICVKESRLNLTASETDEVIPQDRVFRETSTGNHVKFDNSPTYYSSNAGEESTTSEIHNKQFLNPEETSENNIERISVNSPQRCFEADDAISRSKDTIISSPHRKRLRLVKKIGFNQPDYVAYFFEDESELLERQKLNRAIRIKEILFQERKLFPRKILQPKSRSPACVVRFRKWFRKRCPFPCLDSPAYVFPKKELARLSPEIVRYCGPFPRRNIEFLLSS